jgi:hypothetical protein
VVIELEGQSSQSQGQESMFGSESGPNNRRQRIIFQVNEGHRSLHTAYKYRIDFERFLDYIRIHDLDVLLDLGKEAVQELVIEYARSS